MTRVLDHTGQISNSSRNFGMSSNPMCSSFWMNFVNGGFPKVINASFIALIPKVQDPQSLNQYRPISLIGSIYKIVAKLLGRRLKRVMPDIIDERQTAFIEGRHMLHNVLIASEVVEEVK